MVKHCYPSQDWGWAVQWVDKEKCEVAKLSDEPDQIMQNAAQSQARANDAFEEMSTLLQDLRDGNRVHFSISDIITRQRNIELQRRKLAQQLSSGQFKFND